MIPKRALAASMFIGMMCQAPTFAAVQFLAPLRMRATASAVLLFATNIVGLGIGPAATGALSDALAPRYGTASIAYALLGGKEPKELPELMRDRNPINFADDVQAPVLVLIGRNDSRCPYRQAMRYVEKLAERGHPHEVYVFETGHGSFDVDERVRQVETILGFLARHVPGVRAAS